MELATALRRGPFMVDGLLGGFDEEEGPSLHFFDYLASSQKVLRGAQGYIHIHIYIYSYIHLFMDTFIHIHTYIHIYRHSYLDINVYI
jgi:hypothetical protein